MSKNLWQYVLGALLVALPLHSGYASAADKEQRLRERVRGYWEAKVALDESRYAYYLPKEKGGPSKRRAKENGAVRYSTYEIIGVTIEGDVATVRTRNQYSIVGRGAPARSSPKEKTVKHRWVWVDGEWYKPAPIHRTLGERFKHQQRMMRGLKAQKAEAASAGSEAAAGGGSD